MGGPHPKAISTSHCLSVFIRRERESRRDQGRGLRVLSREAYTPASGVCSDNWLKVSKTSGAGMLGGPSLTPLKSAPGALKRTGCLFAVTRQPKSAPTEITSKDLWGELHLPTADVFIQEQTTFKSMFNFFREPETNSEF